MLQDMQALTIADSTQARLFCHLTKNTQEFLDVQLTDVYGSCVVELKRSWMQEATLLTTVYLCTTPIDFLQFHWLFKFSKAPPVATVAMHVAEVKRFADLSRRDAVSTQVQCGSPKRYGVTSTLVRRDGARSMRVSKQVQTIWMCWQVHCSGVTDEFGGVITNCSA